MIPSVLNASVSPITSLLRAKNGTLSPLEMPPVPVADLVGAAHAVSAALSLLFTRERGQGVGYEQVVLSETARVLAEPLR